MLELDYIIDNIESNIETSSDTYNRNKLITSLLKIREVINDYDDSIPF